MQKLLCLTVVLSLFSFAEINQQYSSISFSRSALSIAKDASTGSLELTKTIFKDSVKRLYEEIDLHSYNLNYEVFEMGVVGYNSLRSEGKVGNKNILTIIDFTKASTEKRFYAIDLENKSVLFHSLVAHGRNTGENMAKFFSNKQHSNQSSLGFYLTGETYVGSKGYSLRLDGQEDKFNGNLRSRAVVIHAADYVSEAWAKRAGRIGRSQGCPALPNEINKAVIDTLKNKTVVFAYYNEDSYLKSSAYLDVDRMMKGLTADVVQAKTTASANSIFPSVPE